MRVLRNQHVLHVFDRRRGARRDRGFLRARVAGLRAPLRRGGDRATRLNFLLILPYMAVLIMWSLAILLSALGFGFHTGQFGRKSRAWVPRVCIGLFLFHRYAFILIVKQIHWLLFPEARNL